MPFFLLVPGLALAQIPQSALDAINAAESAAGAAATAAPKATGGLVSEGLRSCVGDDDLVIKDQTLKLDKEDKRWAVVAMGSCDVILENVTIEGPRGILLTGSGDVVLKKVTLKVTEHGVRTTGSSEIVLQGVTLKSKKGIAVEATGTSEVEVKSSKLKAKRPFAFTGTATLAVDGKTKVNGKRYRPRKR
jgi:hypothetical protein